MLTGVSASPKLLFLCWPCFGAASVGQSPCCSQCTSAHSLPCAAAAFPAPSPSPLALLCCAGYHRGLLGRDFGFLGFLHRLFMVLLQDLGSVCTGEFCHLFFLGCAVEMFWSKSSSVPQSFRFFPDPGSCAGWLPLPVMLIHDMCSGSWPQFTLAEGCHPLSWINEFKIH